MAYGPDGWTPRKLLVHVAHLPAESRTMRALVGSTPGMNLEQQLLVSIGYKLDVWDWKYQMMHLDPKSKDPEVRQAASELKKAQPVPPDMSRSPGWIDGGRIRTTAEMLALRAEENAKRAEKTESRDNQAETQATGTVDDFAGLMSGG